MKNLKQLSSISIELYVSYETPWIHTITMAKN